MPIIAAVIAAGATAYAANKQSQTAKKAAKASAANTVQPVDLQAEQRKALEGNLANQGKIQQLTGSTNAFNQSQANSMMESALPGWGALQSKLMSTTQGLLTNPYDLPPEVQQNLGRIAAERGVSMGTRGSQFSEFSLLRDLGINSLQYGQSRINQAQGLTGLLASTAPKANVMSPLAFMVTPQEFAQNQTNQNANNQAVAQGAINARTQATNYQTAGYANAAAQLAGGVDWAKMFGSSPTTSPQTSGPQLAGQTNAQAMAGYNSFWG